MANPQNAKAAIEAIEKAKAAIESNSDFSRKQANRVLNTLDYQVYMYNLSHQVMALAETGTRAVFPSSEQAGQEKEEEEEERIGKVMAQAKAEHAVQLKAALFGKDGEDSEDNEKVRRGWGFPHYTIDWSMHGYDRFVCDGTVLIDGSKTPIVIDVVIDAKEVKIIGDVRINKPIYCRGKTNA